MAVHTARPPAPFSPRDERKRHERHRPDRRPAELTRYIETRYHARRREQLPQLAELAERVEAVHAGDEDAPASLALPAGACRTWTALYEGLAEFVADLVAHIRLQNEVLFPQCEEAARHG